MTEFTAEIESNDHQTYTERALRSIGWDEFYDSIVTEVCAGDQVEADQLISQALKDIVGCPQ
jgi:hypothetical protein